MIGMIAIVGLNSANAQNMSTQQTNVTGINVALSNETMNGNTTGSENMTNSSSPMMTNSS